MMLIQPRCRDRFAAEDIDFVVAVLGQRGGAGACLVQLLSDEESRDLLLDDEALLKALMESGGCLRVTCRFYFYVLVRHMLRRAGIEDREVADYVAEVLSEFSDPERGRWMGGDGGKGPEYFFEMMAALAEADERKGFLLRLHMGNYALFLTGVFPERIRSRAERKGFPDLSYYERIGTRSYQEASDHPLAQRYELATVLGRLAGSFSDTRLALNDIAERLFCMGEEGALERMLAAQLGRN